MKLSSSYLRNTAPAQTRKLIIRRRRYYVLQTMTTKLLLDCYPTMVVPKVLKMAVASNYLFHTCNILLFPSSLHAIRMLCSI
jgi:hypothetical protein